MIFSAKAGHYLIFLIVSILTPTALTTFAANGSIFSMITGDADLFVGEEEAGLNIEIEDDPVVHESPIYLNGSTQDRLVLLQYPTRPKTSEQPVRGYRIKPMSQVVETDVETVLPEKYINPNRSHSGEDGMSQKYQGILKEAEGRYAVGRIGADGALRLSVFSKCGQLRPYFVNRDASKENYVNTSPAAPGPLRSVQLSVKSSGDQALKHSGVLEFWKKANNEAFIDYDYREHGDLDDEPPANAESCKVELNY